MVERLNPTVFEGSPGSVMRTFEGGAARASDGFAEVLVHCSTKEEDGKQ